MRRMLLVFTAAMVLALMMLAMALPAFAGGGGDDEDNDKESASGDRTRNGQIVFRRYLDPDQTKGAIFTMNPDGTHVSQITPPPNGWSDEAPVWSPDGTKVAFSRGCLPSQCEEGSRIMVVDANTGDTRKVTQ